MKRARSLKHLAKERNFRRVSASTKRKPWMVHPKPSFGGPKVTMKYLARQAVLECIPTLLEPQFERGRVFSPRGEGRTVSLTLTKRSGHHKTFRGKT